MAIYKTTLVKTREACGQTMQCISQSKILKMENIRRVARNPRTSHAVWGLHIPEVEHESCKASLTRL